MVVKLSRYLYMIFTFDRFYLILGNFLAEIKNNLHM